MYNTFLKLIKTILDMELPKYQGEYRVYRQHELPTEKLIGTIDPYLVNQLGTNKMHQLLNQISATQDTVLDIGASRSIGRATAFFDATHTLCVDPAYEHYESKEGVGFGIVYEKQNMINELRSTFSEVRIPAKIQGQQTHLIEGTRAQRKRSLDLIPQRILDWLSNPNPSEFHHVIAWRTFLPAEVWGEIINRLPIGGVLMTSGYGEQPAHPQFRPTAQPIAFTSLDQVGFGIDVENTPLPRNGNTQAVGLLPLTNLKNIYFYRKNRHLGSEEIGEALRQNFNRKEMRITGIRKYLQPRWKR